MKAGETSLVSDVIRQNKHFSVGWVGPSGLVEDACGQSVLGCSPLHSMQRRMLRHLLPNLQPLGLLLQFLQIWVMAVCGVWRATRSGGTGDGLAEAIRMDTCQNCGPVNGSIGTMHSPLLPGH